MADFVWLWIWKSKIKKNADWKVFGKSCKKKDENEIEFAQKSN